MLLNLEDLQLKIGDDSFILRRFERTDWKKIASVNLEQLKASSADWRVIEDNIGNVLYCHVESEFERKSLDANLVKMFQLSQVVVSYLLHIRQLAFAELSSLKQQLTTIKKTLESAVKDKDEAVRKWKELKKSVKNQNKLAPATDYYKCPWCSKAFLNRDYLASHLQRRHTHNKQTNAISSTGQGSTSNVAAAASWGGELLLDELKTRLQMAERQLTEEKLLLHTIISKMDESNVSLQGVVVNEVQKMRETLLKAEAGTRINLTEATTTAGTEVKRCRGENESPLEQLAVVVCTATAASIEPNDHDDDSIAVTLPIQQRQSSPPQEEATGNAAEASPQHQINKNKIAVKSRSSSSSSSEDEEEENNKKMTSTLTTIDRHVLMERFKKTMEAALEQRMQRLIASTVRKENDSSKKEKNKKKLTAEEARRAIANISSTTTTTTSAYNSADYRRMRRVIEAEMNQRLNATTGNNKTDTHKVKSSCSRKKDCNAPKKENTTTSALNSSSNRRPLITIRSQVPPSTAAAAAVSMPPPPAATSSPVQRQQRAPVPTPRLTRGTTLTTTKMMKAMEIGGDDSEREEEEGRRNASMNKKEEEEELLMARDGEATTMTSAIIDDGVVKGDSLSRIERHAQVIVTSTSDEPVATAVPRPSTVSNAVHTLSSNSKPTPPSPPVRSPFTQLTTTMTATTEIRKKEEEEAEEETDDSFSLSSLDAILSELKRPGNKFGVVLPPPSMGGATVAAPIKSVQWRVPVVESEQQKPAPLDESWDS